MSNWKKKPSSRRKPRSRRHERRTRTKRRPNIKPQKRRKKKTRIASRNWIPRWGDALRGRYKNAKKKLKRRKRSRERRGKYAAGEMGDALGSSARDR